MLAQVKQRDELRVVRASAGTPEGIMGGVGLQGRAVFSTRRDFKGQVCRLMAGMDHWPCTCPQARFSLQEGVPVM